MEIICCVDTFSNNCIGKFCNHSSKCHLSLIIYVCVCTLTSNEFKSCTSNLISSQFLN